jgi:glutathione synthase/RimK-type ligase-like ATP-grasp enzyme
MATEIDLKTGKLVRPALDKDLNEFTHHPKTNVKIEGFQIPFFKEVKEMVKEAALESDKILVVGWDVAITDEGPLIIEGNRRPGFDVVQVASRRGRMDIIRDVLEKYNK